MPSDEHTGLVAALVAIGVVVPLYTVVVSQRLLPGLGVGLSALVTAALVARDGAGRGTLVRATMAVSVVYGAFTLQLPVAVIAACAVYLSAWVTGADSPFGAPDTEIVPIEPGVTGEVGDGESSEDSEDSEDEEDSERSGDGE
ncbi:hypothetical protein [Halorubrum tebenquichense]|uniref:Uncharacterized protein n=1 Tax=Halorubrum tebenquichense DSM 14210 TaxID=1227485 RepID=M0DPR9_9EURY|nr:hypothetical protein [Halorubrum tebenquichense]ELZ37486.1 hypothetical protein C472_08519 [Halorubrum tebenquichense DSM 14210]